MFKYLIIAHIQLTLFLLMPGAAFAYTEIVGLFIDKGTASLMRGGLKTLPETQETIDFAAPLFLDSKGKYRLDVGYEYQRTMRIFSGRWEGSHAYAERLESAVAAPFSLRDGKISGNVALGYGYDWFDVNATNTSEGISLNSHDNVKATKGGLYINLFDRLKLGIAAIDTAYRDRLEIPIEAEISTCSFLKLGYKRSYIDVTHDFSVGLSGTSGSVPLRFGEELNELYVIGDYRGLIQGKYANELGKTGNRRFEGKVTLPWSLYLIGNYRQRELNFHQDFTAAEKPGGYLQGELAFREYRAGIGADPTDSWNIELNYRHWNLDSSGGGIANSSAVIDFWPSLVVGNYNHIYDAAVSADQFHAGTVYTGENLTMGFGAQYIALKTAGQLDYWRSILFGLGRTGANSLKLATDRINLLFLSLGAGYHWHNLAINYAFGQFIPLGTHQNEPATAEPSPSSGGGGTDISRSISDRITRNPGGNIQRLVLTVTF